MVCVFDCSVVWIWVDSESSSLVILAMTATDPERTSKMICDSRTERAVASAFLKAPRSKSSTEPVSVTLKVVTNERTLPGGKRGGGLIGGRPDEGGGAEGEGGLTRGAGSIGVGGGGEGEGGQGGGGGTMGTGGGKGGVVGGAGGVVGGGDTGGGVEGGEVGGRGNGGEGGGFEGGGGGWAG